ncbi:hypothetical protein ACFS5J_12170 [Flavobacterium chuncheonense]|uniref:Uncharacterized protein n=1 Tax=Flavobacterium chuncheonense TaxID=2026653 RepID=A0ABW5YQ87_9FLAO
MERSNFYLNKWFLDFIGNNGETMIFYSAKLSWKGLSVFYASWIDHNPQSGVTIKSHFFNVKIPEIKDNFISWHDDKFEIQGTWKAVDNPIYARLFESDGGYLDWNCFQPASEVHLKIKDKHIYGKGYVEQLILTTPPWHIPMDDLRWGRFHSLHDTIVWIEIRKEHKQQWLWYNGEKIMNCKIEDDQIISTEKHFILKLNRNIVLESEKKIFQVVQKLLNYLPGFNKLIPSQFLMADNHKWVSIAELQKSNSTIIQGMAIHEWVNFNAKNQ